MYGASSDNCLDFFFCICKKMNREDEQQVLDIAITAARMPRRVASGRTILATGQGEGRKKYLVLANGNELTRAGEYYYDKTKQVKPNRHFDPNQQTVRKGDGDYIQTSSGLKRVRLLDPAGQMQLTTLGKKFYQNKHTEYVIEIPVLIRTTDSKGTWRERTGEHLPVNELGVGNIFANDGMTEAEKIAKIKNDVLRRLGGPTRNGRSLLMEISGQEFFYDRNGTWLISAMTTYIPTAKRRVTGKQADPRAPPRTEAVLHRDLSQGDPLGAVSSASFLPHDPEAYLEEAFQRHEDRLCVPRQLAALTRRPMEEICASFDGLLEERWREEGVRPQEIEKWCALHGHPYFLVRTGKLIKIVDPPEKLGKAIAYCVFDGHAFFYKSAKTVANWTVTQSSTRQVIQHEHRQQLPEMSEWKDWSMPPTPGHYFHDDLDRVRRTLLESGRSPKVTLHKGARITSLAYKCTQALDGCTGTCVVRKEIEHREEIERWLGRFVRQITWNAEALPALTHKVLNELLRAERRSCPAEQRKAILTAQNNQCALCGGIFDNDIEWDHRNPLQQTIRGQATNWQAICASCHVEKTGLEGKQDRTLESTFSLPVWKEFVESPRPPPIVTCLHAWGKETETLELDVRRCRRNALAISAHHFSVFSPLDSITASQEGTLGDFSFVALDPRKKSLAKLLPYTGPGWYHRVAVEHLLHYGQITWQDISHSLSSTGRVPPECLAEPLKQMEEAWGDQEDLAKLSVNQMIGLWASDATQVFHVKTSNDACDGLGAYAKRYVEFKGGHTCDYIFASELLVNTSMRPIHDQIMCTEHTRLAQLLFCLEALKVPPRYLKCIKTDCVVLQGPIKKRKAELESLAELTFEDLSRLRTRISSPVESNSRRDYSQQLLDCYCSISEHKFSKDSQVFRLGEGKELQGHYSKPWRESKPPGTNEMNEQANLPSHSFHLRPPGGNGRLEQTGTSAQVFHSRWKDVSKEEALELMLEGKGLLVVGSPGTGKTHWLRNAIASLRQSGKKVEIVAKTHAAVQNIGCEAKTADHWVRKHVRNGGVHCHTLVVEELTQINSQLWSDLALCRFKGVAFVCAGDFGQFAPICEHWCGCPVPEGSLENSDMLWEMCGGNRLTLTENMRSDARLFDAYTNLGDNLQEALERARALFPVTSRPARYTLTISHKNRMRINRMRNMEDAKDWDSVFLKAPKETRGGNQPQDMILWKGLQLIGAGHRCLKGLFYEVEEVCNDSHDLGAKCPQINLVKLTSGLVLTHEQAVQSLRLCYSLTYASCQGLTLPGVVRLDTKSEHFTLKHLYVGLSRATAADLVEVE